IVVGETYHMWYSQVAIQPFLFRIGYARSPDGIHWTRIAGSGIEDAVLDWGSEGSFDQYSVSWPSVIRVPEELYVFCWHIMQFPINASQEVRLTASRAKPDKSNSVLFMPDI
ncbi:MAG: hypothetical protein MUE32_00425, partial [Bacteroidales bacterium]|nr:hypothetical protein [Bacteroidales bacterium]